VTVLEAEYYEPMARWARKELGCFETGINTGLRHGRIDVVGLRDTGGRLSGRADVIAIEVKRGTQPFATSIGQASGYSIYADRCYLAEYRPRGFTDDERAIASQLGVGLIKITGDQRVRISEVLTAPLREPLEGLRLEVVEKLHLSLCTVCGSLFRCGEKGKPFANVARQQPSRTRHLERAASKKMGLMYWLDEQADRSPKATNDVVYHRRYVCPNCVSALFGHLAAPE
jgi:hypothetical protein